MRVQSLKTIHLPRNLVLLGCALPPSIGGHGWLKACSLVAAFGALHNLADAYRWKSRIKQIRASVEERAPGAEILDWERPFAEREWGAKGVIYHPFTCRLLEGEVVRFTALTDAGSFQVLRLQSARPSELYREVY